MISCASVLLISDKCYSSTHRAAQWLCDRSMLPQRGSGTLTQYSATVNFALNWKAIDCVKAHTNYRFYCYMWSSIINLKSTQAMWRSRSMLHTVPIHIVISTSVHSMNTASVLILTLSQKEIHEWPQPYGWKRNHSVKTQENAASQERMCSLYCVFMDYWPEPAASPGVSRHACDHRWRRTSGADRLFLHPIVSDRLLELPCKSCC